MRPLGQGFQMIDRLPGFNLDNGLEPPAALEGIQNHVGVHRSGGGGHRDILLGAGVDGCVVLSPVFGLQQADDAVVLELLADWSHQDGAHLAASKWLGHHVIKTPKSNMEYTGSAVANRPVGYNFWNACD